MNREKLDQLDRPGGVLRRRGDTRLAREATKLGKGTSNMVLGTESIQTNLPHPTDPGFDFSPRGTVLRQGAHLDVEGSYQKLFFKGGGEQFNPLGHQKASSTTDPLPQIMPSLRGQLQSVLSQDMRRVLDLVRTLPV